MLFGKNRGWSACPMKLYKLCAALSPPVLYPPGKVIFLGPCRLPPRLRALTLGTMGAGASLPHCHLREGRRAVLLPCPVPPPQGDHPGLSDRSQDVLAVVPAVWRCWSPARWPKAAEGPKQCMSVESCHILLLNPSQPRPVWFQVGRQTPPPPQLPSVLYELHLCSLVAQWEVEIENHCYFTLKKMFFNWRIIA